MSNDAVAAVKQVEAAVSQAEEAELAISSPDPLSTNVVLPSGLTTLRGRVTDATVRELNGADEEFISRAGTTTKMLRAILHRGVDKIGDEVATPDLIDKLAAGDVTALLLKIRQVTFGDEIELFGIKCPTCGNDQTVILRISEDIPSDPYNGLDILDLRLSVGRVIATPPTYSVTNKVSEAIDSGKTQAEAITTLLYGCVQSINGDPVISEGQLRQLSVRDRRKVYEALESATPGPRLAAVSVNCGGCEEVLGLPIAMAQLFRF